MRVLLTIFIVLHFSVLSFAKTDFSTPEYNKTAEIVNLKGYEITASDIDKVMTYALMETDRIWESNIFGQIRHGLKNSEVKYSVTKYLMQNLADVFFHPNEYFSFKGQKFSITQNTRSLALESFWDLAQAKLETKDVLDLLERRMFDITLMAMSDNKNEHTHAKNFLNKSLIYIQNNRHNAHLDLFALGVKNQLFNIFAAAESAEVQSLAHKIITMIIKNGKNTNPVSLEFKATLADISKTISFQTCRNMWN